MKLYTLEDVRKNPTLLRVIPKDEQTEAMCLEAVTQYGYLLDAVCQQTPAVALAAVRQNGMALQFVVDKTEAICLAAVSQNGMALQFVDQQTPENCLAAVCNTGHALQYATKQSEAICLEAVSRAGIALEFAVYQTPDIVFAAIQQNSQALMGVGWPVVPINSPHTTLLEDWLTVISACEHCDQSTADWICYPLMNAVKLGKQYQDEWQHPASGDSNKTRLEILVELASSLRRLLPSDMRVSTFCHDVNRQVELALAAGVQNSVKPAAAGPRVELEGDTL